MKKIQIIINIVLILAVAFLLINPLKKEIKIGFADNSILINQITVVKNIQTQLEEEFAKYNSQIKEMEVELNKLKAVADYDTTNPENKAAYDKKVVTYNQLIQKIQTETTNRQNELLNPIYNSINKLIEEWGDANKYNIIWGAQPSGNILYGESGSDLTDELITYLNDKL